MKTIIVRYTTRDDAVAENEALARAVFDELRAKSPAGLRYRTYREADGATFVHMAEIDGDNPLPTIEAFKAFTRDIEERCVVAPVAVEFVPVDAYSAAAL
jgi:hypothetical protein